MKKDKREKEFKKTQSTSSPGALGEDANTNMGQSRKPREKKSNKTSRDGGINEEHSRGSAGAFEGLENTHNS